MDVISFKISDSEAAILNAKVAKAATTDSKHKYARQIVVDHLSDDRDDRIANELHAIRESIISLREDLATVAAQLLVNAGKETDPEKAKTWAKRHLFHFLLVIIMGLVPLSKGKTDYYRNLTKRSVTTDYYQNDNDPHGVYLPTRGAKLLGLKGEITRTQFNRLLQGYCPITGKKLVQNAGKPDRVTGFDYTVGFPKSYSVWKGLLPFKEQAKLRRIEIEAVAETFKWYEAKACFTRRGKHGYRREKASMFAAAYCHLTNRGAEPHAHLHTVCFSPTLREDGTSGTIESRPLYKHQKEIGIRIQRAVARKLRKEFGMKVAFEGNTFRILGVPQCLCDFFSERSKEIQAYMAEHGDFSDAAAEEACKKTRQSKKKIPPLRVLQRYWRKIGAEYGFSTEQALDLLHGRVPQQHLKSIQSNERITKPATEAISIVKQPNRVTEPKPTSKECSADKLIYHNRVDPKTFDISPALPTRPVDDVPPFIPPDNSKDKAMPIDSKLDRQVKDLLSDPSGNRSEIQLNPVLNRYLQNDSRLHPEIKDLLSDPAPNRIPPQLRDVIDQYLHNDNRLHKRHFERQVHSLHRSRHRLVPSRKIESVLSRYSHKRNPIIEEIRYHLRQIRRAAMNKKTYPIDRQQVHRNAHCRFNKAHADKVRDLVSSPSRLQVLMRKKSYNMGWTIRVARDAWESAGYKVLGTSLSRRRVSILEQIIGLESYTYRTLQLLMDPSLKFRLKHTCRQFVRAAMKRHTYTIDRLKISKKTVLIVDSADTLSEDQLSFLIKKVRSHGGKLVLLQSPNPCPVPGNPFFRIAKQIKHIREPPDRPNPDPSTGSTVTPKTKLSPEQLIPEI